MGEHSNSLRSVGLATNTNKQARITTKLSTQVPLSSVLRAPPKSAAHYRSTALPLQPFAMTDQALKVYRGNCHCKSYIFEAKLPEIKTVYGCNCSLCVRKATLYYIIPGPADLTWVKGNETSMNNYMFGPKTFNHKVCQMSEMAERLERPLLTRRRSPAQLAVRL